MGIKNDDERKAYMKTYYAKNRARLVKKRKQQRDEDIARRRPLAPPRRASESTLEVLEAEAKTRSLLKDATDRLNAYDLVQHFSNLTEEQDEQRENIISERETFTLSLRLLGAEIDRRDAEAGTVDPHRVRPHHDVARGKDTARGRLARGMNLADWLAQGDTRAEWCEYNGVKDTDGALLDVLAIHARNAD